MSKRVRYRLYTLSETYGWITKFFLMMWLLESVLALVFVGIAAITGVLYGGPVGLLVFAGLWIVTGTPVYYWNRARKAQRTEGFDDRLTDEQMAKGRDKVISHFEKQRQDQESDERTD